MITKLIKLFLFSEHERVDLTFSDITKIRLNTEKVENARCHLKRDSNDNYPLDSDIYVKTAISEPNALMVWQGVEIFGNVPTGTSILLRIYNGANEYYHDGVSWVIANSTDWNTEDDFNDHLTEYSFPDNTKKIGLLVNLKTTIKTKTPSVSEIRLLGQYDIDFYDDIISSTVDSFINNLRYPSEISAVVDSTASSFDLNNEYKMENDGYNIVSIESVYDTTNDPLKKTNIFNAYTPGSPRNDGTLEPGIVTTTQPITGGDDILIRFVAEPEVSVNTNQDYYDLIKMPGIVFEKIRVQRITDGRGQFSHNAVRNKTSGTAVLLQSPAQNNIRFEYSIFTLLQLDLQNLLQEIKRYLNEVGFIISSATGDKYYMEPLGDIVMEQTSNLDDINTLSGVFEIKSVLFFLRQPEDVQLVSKVMMDFTTKESRDITLDET